MNATDNNGRLKVIPGCYLQIGTTKIPFNNLPDLSDAKAAEYNSESIMNRAAPIKTYQGSGDRTFNLTINLFVQDADDPKKNLRMLRLIQSATYPRLQGLQTFPPVICKIKFGSLLSNNPLCCILRDYNVRFPTDVPWDEETLCPYRLEIGVTLEAVYSSNNLPGNELILSDIP